MTTKEAKERVIALFKEIEAEGLTVDLCGGCGESPSVTIQASWRDYEEIHIYDY